MNRDVLRRPFTNEHVKTRPGHNGKAVSYVDVATVLQRLHEACDTISFEVLRHEILEEEVVVVARLTADGVVNVDFGCASITRDPGGRALSIGDDLKAASSDAIKRCARLLGCPLDLHTQTERAPARRADARLPGGELITERQVAALQSICRQQNIGRGQLVALVEKRTKKSDVQLLTKGEASALIAELGLGPGTMNGNGNGAHA